VFKSKIGPFAARIFRIVEVHCRKSTYRDANTLFIFIDHYESNHLLLEHCFLYHRTSALTKDALFISMVSSIRIFLSTVKKSSKIGLLFEYHGNFLLCITTISLEVINSFKDVCVQKFLRTFMEMSHISLKKSCRFYKENYFPFCCV
jgi:hypothetical protein